MGDLLESKKRPCDYFTPKKYTTPKQFHISDHAVKKYQERFGNGHGSIRNIIKSVIDSGESVMYKDEENQVIHKAGVFAIVKDAEVKTVYTSKIFAEARERILKNWGCGSNEE